MSASGTKFLYNDCVRNLMACETFALMKDFVYTVRLEMASTLQSFRAVVAKEEEANENASSEALETVCFLFFFYTMLHLYLSCNMVQMPPLPPSIHSPRCDSEWWFFSPAAAVGTPPTQLCHSQGLLSHTPVTAVPFIPALFPGIQSLLGRPEADR